MCGITGFWDSTGTDASECGNRVANMTVSLAHRGPDDMDTWVDPRVGVALGFRRLAIVDLSTAGRQPMQSASGRYVMVFNGEVYNFAAMRMALELEGIRFRGHSDTEVMLAGFEHWGMEEAIRRCVGMFAIALWDCEERLLWLIRDRLGIKPLYYGYVNGHLLFGSELKALRRHPAFIAEIDRGALALYMRYGYVPAPYSIYQNVHQLLPGTMLRVDSPQEASAAPVRYWSVLATAKQGLAQPFNGSDGQVVDRLETLLSESVKLRMVADVPLGAFLSGGVDSSTVVALMQAQSNRPIKTFSIGFREDSHNEAHHARAVAAHLGTDHSELYISAEEARAVIPLLPDMYDEPFADASQIPTFLVSRLARQSVTVSLSGDGGDELFAGYPKYATTEAIWNWARACPLAVRRATARGITRVPPLAYDCGLDRLEPFMARFGASSVGEKIHRAASMFAERDLERIFGRGMSAIGTGRQPVLRGIEPPTVLEDPGDALDIDSVVQRLMYYDMMMFLPDDILTKVDRASMAVGLEARVPLLDHRVVEFVWTLPLSAKRRPGISKWALRQVLYRHVPPDLIERPKSGFGVPIGEWLRGPLREWTESLLDEQSMQQQGFLDVQRVKEARTMHQCGQGGLQGLLWNVLMFQAWFNRWHQAPPAVQGSQTTLALAALVHSSVQSL